jgi:HD-GYP domain-containing protein (c-di-GMP phosphodiesterase class II)
MSHPGVAGRILLYGEHLEEQTLAELGSAGFEVFHRAAPDQVPDALTADPPPALVLVNARRGSGSALVSEVRNAAPPTASFPVLALVPAASDLSSVPSGLIDDVLFHPVSPVQLLTRVRFLLEADRRQRGVALELQRLTQIGIALSAEHDLRRLLNRIVEEARAINHADAASLYTLDRDAGVLRFQIAQNESLGISLDVDHVLPPVSLDPKNVSAYVALTGEMVSIPDVYEAQGFDFSGPREYDALTAYRSRSMLVVPIRNHEDEVIAVLQLINARDPATGHVRAFESRHAERTLALASQAGVALNNAQLITDLRALLEGLIQALADAVDEKSSYTAGHIRRVTQLSLSLAEAVNACDSGPFGDAQLDEAALEELRVAGLLHDIGKIVVPEHVVDKATKLECVRDRIHEIHLRFSVIRRGLENAALRRKLELLAAGETDRLPAVDQELAAQLAALEADLKEIELANAGSEGMPPERLARLREIAGRTYRDDQGREQPYLTGDELRNLFPRKLSAVPQIAADHHEALDGTGYPYGKTAERLPLQSRILAIADIFDALTASDRPYKKAFPLDVAYSILRENARRGKLDERLVELFIQSECHTRLQSEPPPN